MHVDPLSQTFLLVASSFLAVAVLVRLRLSPIVGYLSAGLLLGPSGLGVVAASSGADFFAELGVAFLMFVIGLEFSFPRIVAAGRMVFGAGAAQVCLTMLLVATSVRMIGCSWPGALILGGAIAMSSTAIVHKQLIDQDEAVSAHGVAASGILLFQDLAALPFLAFVAALDDRHLHLDPAHVALRIGVSVSVFTAIAFLARRTIGRLLDWTARSRLNEPFLLAAIALIIGGALLAEVMGLSLPIGAFAVGMMVGESDHRHQLEEEIRPFRDLLLGIFFVTVGMSVEWTAFLARPLVSLILLALILLLKFVVVAGVARRYRLDFRASVRTALLLAHCGELGLLIVSEAMAGGMLGRSIGQPALVAVSLSMLIAPVLIQWNERIARMFGFAVGDTRTDRPDNKRDHVILAGCGPVGNILATALEQTGIPYVAIERNLERVRHAKSLGHQVILGDASRPGILRAAGIEYASSLISLVDNWRTASRIVHHSKALSPGLPVIASVRDEIHRSDLERAGVSEIHVESVPAALALVERTLLQRGVEGPCVAERVAALRADIESAQASLAA